MRHEDPAGTRRQTSLRTETRFGATTIAGPARARIEGVQPRGTGKNKSGQTLVDLMLYGWGAPLYGVPILHAKINQTQGEDWTPEIGDLVAVQFFGGDPRDPVVTGYLPRPNNEIEAAAADHPRHHRAHQGTSETITKTGSRVVHVAENETLEVVGNGTVEVGGDLVVTVVGTGTATIKCDKVQLGSDAGLQRLIDERILSYLDAHTHAVPGITSGSSSTTSAVPTIPLTPLVAGIATTKTRAA